MSGWSTLGGLPNLSGRASGMSSTPLWNSEFCVECIVFPWAPNSFFFDRVHHKDLPQQSRAHHRHHHVLPVRRLRCRDEPMQVHRKSVRKPTVRCKGCRSVHMAQDQRTLAQTMAPTVLRRLLEVSHPRGLLALPEGKRCCKSSSASSISRRRWQRKRKRSRISRYQGDHRADGPVGHFCHSADAAERRPAAADHRAAGEDHRAAGEDSRADTLVWAARGRNSSPRDQDLRPRARDLAVEAKPD